MRTHSDVDDLTLIRLYRREAGLSKARLAINAGLHPNALRGMDAPGWNPHWETVRKIKALIPDGWQPQPEQAA